MLYLVEPEYKHLDFWCALLKIFFFQYNKIISTYKLPFHNPLVMKYYNVLAYFSLDYENSPLTKFSWSIILHVYCIYPIHINYMALD